MEVSGPFGKGLEVASDGIHIAFAAGTGVLTFMDLVAQIALFNLGFGRNLGQESFARQVDIETSGITSKLSLNHASDRTEESKQLLIEEKSDEFRPKPLSPPVAYFGNRFKFVFYISFASRSDSVGIKLCEALADYCKINALANFEVVIRLSREGINADRWDSAFIRKELAKHNANEVRKVWVCGPPPMSETFEKTFEEIKAMNNGLYHQFDIL